MLREVSLPAISAGLLAAAVGFASSFAVVLEGLTAAGASPAEAASGLMALSLAMGVAGVLLSAATRMPVSVAWSTPGAALLATTGPIAGGFPAAVGGFVACSALLVLAGLWRPLGRWVAAIPASLANAMLAGVLLGLCLAPVRAVADRPGLALPVVLAWLLVARWRRLYAVPAAVLVAGALVVASLPAGTVPSFAWTAPLPVIPAPTTGALLGIALPLFVVTMAAQNVPGLAVLQVNGYRPDPGPLLRVTGLLGLLAAPFGGHAVNLAAITAALCAGPEAHPDPARRYWAAIVAGLVYIGLGLIAGTAVALAATAPPLLIQAVAGLALLPAFAAALLTALSAPADREAAAVTFLVAASGLSIAGIGGAFWGLVAGGAVLLLTRWRRVTPP